ncbi:MAG: acetoacetyl-CoA synthetase [Candidatus Roseilinea sp.]|nr:MAG: acetoacetyl-CoA synthetase [Candidatus Roseilinea sp.]
MPSGLQLSDVVSATKSPCRAYNPVAMTVLWQPSDALRRESNLRRYMDWLARHRALTFEDYDALWRWSVSDIEAFWTSLWDYFDVRASRPAACALAQRRMPGAQWFPGARLNYAEHAFRNAADDRPALIFRTETNTLRPETGAMSWDELRRAVAAIAAALRKSGVVAGDRVAAYVPNMPEAVIAFLACASLGAIWSSCSPDIGASAVLDRFKQIEPKVLFAVDGYIYNGKPNDRRGGVAELIRSLPTLQCVFRIPYLQDDAAPFTDVVKEVTWEAALDAARNMPGDLRFEQVPFDHPLWVLYSSGTTGLPKPIVHSHGGILIEHLKALSFHLDLKPSDRFFWFTTTGWMMWNFVIGGLLVGSTVLLYDGSPARDDMGALWRFAEETGMTVFGTSAAYITACIKAGISLRQRYDLSALRHIGSTGSPLSEDGFRWVYGHVKPEVWLAPMSGGTDVCTAFVGGCPLLPVYLGEMQCRYLGANVQAFDEHGRPLVDEVGELVVTAPMPSMPIYFWNDPDMRRYRESYFEMFPGVWRHGDWVKITPRGGVVIYGRSDSTINRQGVRIGTSELYRVVESVPEVLDALVIDLEVLGRPSYMPLFVVLREGVALDDALIAKIKQAIRTELSARHVPDDVIAIAEVPRTLNGKKLEVPVKKILLGAPMEKAVNLGSVANPQALQFFVEFAQKLNRADAPSPAVR